MTAGIAAACRIVRRPRGSNIAPWIALTRSFNATAIKLLSKYRTVHSDVAIFYGDAAIISLAQQSRI
jgi:hypothetical protein